VGENPTGEDVSAGAAAFKNAGCDGVIALGGGSGLDCGKAVAVLAGCGGSLWRFAWPDHEPAGSEPGCYPVIAIPTTAGTGAEVTRNAVLASPEHRVKVSLRGALLLPRVAVVDPELTSDLPPALTASTGLDALTQLIEPFVSGRANSLTDALCREGMGRAARSLQRACEPGRDAGAREDMALASLLGGLALANAGLGAVHGFAAPLGGMFSAPHGAVCAALLPHVMTMNLRALRQRQPESEALRRYDETARILTGRDRATADEGVAWVQELCGTLQIPRLRAYAVTAEALPNLVERAALASSMKGNPISLTSQEMRTILERAL
jgi:alcohol dehydrogenase class IV